MIEKMSKLTLVVHHAARTELLDQLQALGVYHVDLKVPAVTDKISALREHIAHLGKYHQLLSGYQKKYKVNLPQDAWKGDMADLVAEIDEIKNAMDAAANQADALRKEATVLRHYGEFDPEIIAALEKAKLKTAFCSCARSKFSNLDFTGLAMEVLSESRGGISYVVFYHRSDKFDEKQQEVLANQEEVPSKRLSQVQAEIAACEDEIDAKAKALIDRTKYLTALSDAMQMDQDQLALELAHTGMLSEAEGAVYVLTGFVPTAKLQPVEDFLGSQAAVYIVEEPTHHDKVPVKLKQNPFARLFEPILRLSSIPNYWELDTTPFFAPFYALYFGLCIADAGYGLLLFAILLIAFFVIKAKKSRKVILLGMVLSLSCVFGGVILDDYFGVRPVVEYEHEMTVAAHSGGEAISPATSDAVAADVPTHEADAPKAVADTPPPAPGILQGLAIFRNRDDAMLLPLMLGIIQVLFGWVLRIRNQVRHHGWQGFGQPTGNILIMLGVVLWVLPLIMQPLFKADPNTFHIGPFQIHYLFSAVPAIVSQIMLFGGIALVLLFNGLENGTKVYLRPLTGLWAMYELAQHLVGDTLSYIRLFALGLAGGLLAEAFNNIAMNMVKDSHGPLPYVLMTLVLLLGHFINLGIGLLSAFVHSLRLQFVEFYNAIEFKGGGVEYTPLQKTKPLASTQSVKKQIGI